MSNPLLRDLTPAQHQIVCEKNDGRTDFEYRSECGWVGLLRDGEGFLMCCGGFYSLWYGSLQQGIDFINALGQDD